MLRNLFLFSLQKATEKTRLSCAQRHEGALKNLNDTLVITLAWITLIFCQGSFVSFLASVLAHTATLLP